MKTKLLPLAVAAIAMLLFSCQSSVSITKKRYSNGYYVSLSHNEKEKAENIEAPEYKKDLSAASKEVNSEKENIEILSAASVQITPPTHEIDAAKTPTTAENPTPIAEKVKKIKAALKKKNAQKKSLADDKTEMSDRFLIILLITIIIPPLGVFLHKEEIRPTLIDLLLFVVGAILAPLVAISFFYGLGYLLALVYGLLYIFGKLGKEKL